MNPAAGATAILLSDDAGADPARHADRVEQAARTFNAPSGGPRLLRIPLLRPAAGCAAHFVSRFGGDGRGQRCAGAPPALSSTPPTRAPVRAPHWLFLGFVTDIQFVDTLANFYAHTPYISIVLDNGATCHRATHFMGRVTDPANLRVATPANGTAVVNVVYKDVLAVGEARGV